MKKRLMVGFFLSIHLLCGTPLWAQLTQEEEKQFANLVNSAHLLTSDTDPHVYDPQIPAWTNQLTALFPQIISPPLPTYEAARDRLVQGAQNFDAIDPNRKTVFNNT